MSGQRSRKIRFGSSRHRASKQNDPDDGIHKSDSPPAAQGYEAQENTDSLVDLAKLNYSESGNQHLPTSEAMGNRRKLGSSRRNKGRRDVKDSITEAHNETREEVEDNTLIESLSHKGSTLLPSANEIEAALDQVENIVEPDLSNMQLIHSENPREPMVVMTELHEPTGEENRELSENMVDKQRELMLDEETVQDKPNVSKLAINEINQENVIEGGEHDTESSRRDSSLYSPSIPQQSFKSGNSPTSPEALLESLAPRSEDVVVNVIGRENDIKPEASNFSQSAEIMFEGMDKPFQSEVSDQVNSNAHIGGISQLSSFSLDSVLLIDPQLSDRLRSREKPFTRLSSVQSLMQAVNEEREVVIQPLKQRETPEDTESTVPEVIPDEPTPLETSELEDTVEHSRITLPAEELPTHERQSHHFELSEVTDDNLVHRSEDVVYNQLHAQDEKQIQSEDVGSSFLVPSKSAVMKIRDNEEMTNEELTTSGITRSLLGEKDHDVTEASEEKREVEELEVMEISEVLQTENVETPLNTLYGHSDLIKQEQKYHETSDTTTGQYHEQDLCVGATDLHDTDLEHNSTGVDVSMALLTKEFDSKGGAPHSEDIDNPLPFVRGSVIQDSGESNRDVERLSVEPSQLEGVMSTEMHITSAAFEGNNDLQNQLLQQLPNNDDDINTDPGVTMKRRKMGSSRRITSRAPKVEKRSDEVKVVQDQEITKDEVLKSEETSAVHEVELDIGTSKDSGGAGKGDENALIGEDIDNPLPFVRGSVIRDSGESNHDVERLSVEPSQLEGVMSTEMHITSAAFEGNNDLQNQLLQQLPNNDDDINTDPSVTMKRRKMGSSRRITSRAPKVEKRSDEVKVVQDQEITKDEVLKSEETSGVHEVELDVGTSKDSGGAGKGDENALIDMREPKKISGGTHNTKSEIKNTSQDSHSEDRRTQLGSTHVDPRITPREENLYDKQEVDNEVSDTEKNVGHESVSAIEKNEPQLQVKLIDGAHLKSSAAHQSHFGSEENPVTEGEQADTEHHLTPSHLSSKSDTFAERDLDLDMKPEGRRRKLGSNRKTRGHQHHKDPIESEDKIHVRGAKDLKSNTEERAVSTFEEHTSEYLGLEKQTQVVTSYDKSGKRPSSNNSMLGSEQVTPIQLTGSGDQQFQQREKRQPLDHSNKCDLGPNCYNVVMIGNSNVGKTSFIRRVQSGTFSSDFCASIGIDTCMQTVTVNGKTVTLRLWDTAGQERFHSITRQIIHKAQAFLLMYDITSFQSFSDVRYWVNCIQEGAADDVIILLLGTKSDCAKRQVHSSEGEVLAKEYNMDFIECSAATGENVIDSMETLARKLSQRSDTTEEDLVFYKEPPKRKTSGCC
ncbi:uncharacterized protein rab44 isoform 2-T2 [Polymixia lowei]